MKYNDARQQLIQTWGQLSTQWGISRTMGQIHVLLMITPGSLTADDIIDQLGVSRGNVSMNLRSLMEWGIINKVFIAGDRKEYFTAEKDAWKMALQIARERKRRELDPAIQTLVNLQNIEEQEDKKLEIEEFKKVTAQLLDVAMQVDKVLDISIRSGGQSVVRKLINVLR